MATTQEKWQEIANRGLQDNFDPQTRAKFDEAVNRGLITMPAQDVAAEPAQPDTSLGEDILGGIDAAGVIASSIIAEPIAGISGIGAAVNPFEERSAGQVVEDVRDRLTIKPEEKATSGQLQSLGETLSPVLDKFTAAEETLGEGALRITGSPEIAAIAHTLPTAALEALGLAGLKGAKKIPSAADKAVDSIPQRKMPITRKGKDKAKLIDLIREQGMDSRTVGFDVSKRPKPDTIVGRLADKLRLGDDVISDNPLELEAVRQGFDKGILAELKDGTQKTRDSAAKMVDLKETGIHKAREGVINKPNQVVGDALMERIDVVRTANKHAGRRIGKVAESLKGQSVDISDAVIDFGDSMSDFGIELIGDGKGGLKPDFEFSKLGPGDRGPIKEVIRQMNIRSRGGDFDALTVHDMKKVIDNNVTFGKAKTGMSGDAEKALKSFRRSLDDALDSNFPAYNDANVQYAETIGALNAFQDVAGKKFDLSSDTAFKEAGQKMRRTLGNADSMTRLTNAIDEIEFVASKYKNSKVGAGGALLIEDSGRKARSAFDDDLMTLTLFADELDARFKPSARGGFENLVGRGVKRGVKEAVSPLSAADVAASVAGKAIEKVKGVTDDTAFKSIRELLRASN